MNVEQFYNYLKQARIESLPFSTEEINEPLLTAYNIVEWAIRDRCTVIEISPQRVVWKEEACGETVGDFATPISFKPHFQLILSRDSRVQEHLHLIEETGTTTKYRIV